MAAKTAAVAWPSVNEYEKAVQKLREAGDQLELIGNALGRFLNADAAPSLRTGVTQPNLSDIARLSLFGEHAQLYLEGIEGNLAHVAALRHGLLLDVDLRENDKAV